MAGAAGNVQRLTAEDSAAAQPEPSSMATHEHLTRDHHIVVDIRESPPLFYISTRTTRLLPQSEIETIHERIALTKKDAGIIAQMEFDAELARLKLMSTSN